MNPAELLETVRPVAERVGWTLVHSTWQAAIAAGGLWVALLLINRTAARARYAVACAALLATVAAMAMTFCAVTVTSRTMPVVAPLNAEFVPQPVTSVPSALPSGVSTPPSPQVDVRDRLAPWLPAVAGAWAVGVVALAVYHLGGWFALRRLTRSAATNADWAGRIGPIADRLRLTRPVRVVESAAACVPAVVGFVRPVILLPLGLAGGLSPAQLDAILAHELAHVRRHDYLANLLQTAAETLLFYHPAVWWMSAQIRQEREHCCDDLAVGVCAGDRATYARALTRVEELCGLPAVAAALAATGGHLLDRVRRILGAHPRRPRGTPIAAVVIAVACIVFAVATAKRPAHAAERPADTEPAKSVPDVAALRDADQDSMLRDLRSRRNELELSLSREGQQYGPQHPKIVLLKNELRTVDERIEQVSSARAARRPTTASTSPILPEDLAPTQGDYRIAPGDLVRVGVMDLVAPGTRATEELRVTQSGKVSLPHVGELPVAGLTPTEAERAAAKAFLDKRIIQDAQVSVQVIEARANTFSAVGPGVAKPGQYPITRNDLRLAEALALCGGADAASTVRVVRGKPDAQRQIEVSMKALLAGDQAVNLVIRPGDILLVATPERKALRIVVDRDRITLDGKAVDQPGLEAALRALPAGDRARTTLEIAAASDDLPFSRYMSVFGRCMNLAQELGMPPVSNVGVARAEQPQANAADEYYVGGLVGSPGAYRLTSRKIRLSQALVGARLPDEGRKHYVTVVRRAGDKEVIAADNVLIEDLLTRRVQDIDVEPKDTITVSAEKRPNDAGTTPPRRR